MYMPDVNVLVYAHRADEKVHARYRQWLEDALNGPVPVALSVLSAVGFLRIVTNRRVYENPTPVEAALAVIDSIATHENCRVVGTGPQHLTRVATLCRDANCTGKLVADAQHAALAIEASACWVTRDGDFARFEPLGLRWEHLDVTKP